MEAKAILFFFFWTLVENGIRPSPVKQVKYILRLNMPFHEFIVPFEMSFMTKKYDDLFQAFRDVCKTFNINPTKYILDKLVGMWNKNKLLAKPYPETIDVLKDLKKDFKIALISNTDFSSVEELIDKFDMKKYFDSIALSYKLGMLKLNPDMYSHVLNDIKVDKSESVMVGDSIESDMATANNAGLKSILIDRLNRREFEVKINNLNELREKIKGL